MTRIASHLAALLLGLAIAVMWYHNRSVVSPSGNPAEHIPASSRERAVELNDASARPDSFVSPQQGIAQSGEAERLLALKPVFSRYVAAYAMAAKADTKVSSEVINGLESHRDNPDSLPLARVFYLHYLTIEPQAAVGLFIDNHPEVLDNRRYSGMFGGAAEVMFDIYHDWALSDFDQAMSHLLRLADGQSALPDFLLTQLASDAHFKGSKSMLALIDSRPELKRAMAFVFSKGRDESFAEAFERVWGQTGDLSLRNRQLGALIAEWANQSPREALARVRLIDNKVLREQLLSQLLFVWSGADPDQALAAAFEQDNADKIATSLLQSLTYKDPQKSIALYEQYQDRLSDIAIRSIIRTWAFKDPRAVAAYLEQSGVGDRAPLVLEMMWPYARQYPDEALAWARRNGVAENTKISRQLAQVVAGYDIGKAKQIFDGLSDGNVKRELLVGIVVGIGKNDFQGAQKWLEQHQGEPGYKAAKSRLLYELITSDPPAAAGVLLDMPSGHDQTIYGQTLVQNWYREDPKQALEWVYGMTKGELRDNLLISLLQATAQYDVETARTIAQQISSEVLRRAQLERLQPGQG